ncbi:beta-1,3-galactosyltransferase 2-like [Hyla sarda]|uniref:beta-1,3-galactosyltransferase 2-like n=1 Tax=Hyla sarda TaxID=327740 RepID=UPI0024C28B5D|nr:beta-1,3-galactosyltransferase 2-like [Hyla sarda]
MTVQIFSGKVFALFLLILVFFSGYLILYKNNKELINSWFQYSPTVQKKIRPINNQTYPAFKHPLAPPYPYPYKFLINQPDKCKNRTPFLVILILGEVHDIDSRHTLRETWGNESLYDVDVVRIFLVGISRVAPDRIQLMLEEESETFGDIIQQDFMDTYYNLTLKTLMGLEWVTKFCPTASYVMKIDNDMFFNIDYLAHQILPQNLPVLQNYFTGNIVANTGPLRSRVYKWYVPKEVYPNDTYPPYCAGPGYLLSADMAKKIYDVSQEIRVIPMEDAFMGICLYELHILPTQPPPGAFHGLKVDYDLCKFKKFVTVHHYAGKELRTIWADFWANRSKTCDS